MDYLIDELTQREIAERIDQAVADVLSELPNHGSEEGMAPVLDHALMQQSFRSSGLSVEFNYRQLNKYTEERPAGADGGLLRSASLSTADAQRLKRQATDMLAFTEEAVAIFYTPQQIYVVDAEHYRASAVSVVRHPLSEETSTDYIGDIPRAMGTKMHQR